MRAIARGAGAGGATGETARATQRAIGPGVGDGGVGVDARAVDDRESWGDGEGRWMRTRDALGALRRRRGDARAPARMIGGRREGRARGGTFATYDDLSPVSEPGRTLGEVLRDIGGDGSEGAWEDRLRAMALANRLVAHHSDVVAASLRPFVLAVASCLASLRSSVCKAAIGLVKTLACHLKGRLDGELSVVLPCILKRSAESTFLTVEADEALLLLVDAASPRALIATLSNHVSERRLQSKIAMALAFCVERRGEEKSLFRGRAGRSSLETALATMNECIRTGNPDARAHVKRCLSTMFDVLGAEEMFEPLRRYEELSVMEQSLEYYQSS